MFYKKSILITGGSGMIGKSIKNNFSNYCCVFLNKREGDLRDRDVVSKIFWRHKPEYVIHLAAKVGGVESNYSNLGDYYTDNIMINTNVLECAKDYKVKKLVSMLSTCVYPANPPSFPLKEEFLHQGEPHFTNFAYAYSKRMLDVQSRAYRNQYGCNFITAIPNNLYGQCDNFDLEHSHVIPAIIRKVYEAKKNKTDVEIWGEGEAEREFTYSKDIASALFFLLENYDQETPINIGNTEQFSIKSVVNMVADMLQYDGKITWNKDKPNGQLKKPSSNQKFLDLGWEKEDYTPFETGLKNTIDWFVKNYPNVRGV